MIITKTVTINITNRNITHFKKMGYDTTITPIEVEISDLSIGSHTKIKTKCENCGIIKEMEYKAYVKYHEPYYCMSCNKIHRENTNIKKYGVKYYMQTDDYNKDNQGITKELQVIGNRFKFYI